MSGDPKHDSVPSRAITNDYCKILKQYFLCIIICSQENALNFNLKHCNEIVVVVPTSVVRLERTNPFKYATKSNSRAIIWS